MTTVILREATCHPYNVSVRHYRVLGCHLGRLLPDRRVTYRPAVGCALDRSEIAEYHGEVDVWKFAFMPELEGSTRFAALNLQCEAALTPDLTLVKMTKGQCEFDSFADGVWRKAVRQPGSGRLKPTGEERGS